MHERAVRLHHRSTARIALTIRRDTIFASMKMAWVQEARPAISGLVRSLSQTIVDMLIDIMILMEGRSIEQSNE